MINHRRRKSAESLMLIQPFQSTRFVFLVLLLSFTVILGITEFLLDRPQISWLEQIVWFLGLTMIFWALFLFLKHWILKPFFVQTAELSQILKGPNAPEKRVVLKALSEAEEELLHLINHDFVTDLPNRSLFEDRLKQAIHFVKGTEKLTAVLLFKVNELKDINDNFGHHAGDEILQAVGERLQEQLPEKITLARLHGNQFGLIHANISSPTASAELAELLINQLSDVFLIGGQTFVISADVGISVYPFDAVSATQLIRNADLAMYRARSYGPNRYQFYVTGMTEEAEAQRKLFQELHRALEKNQFCLHYQPQLNLKSRKIVGVEALLRWNHPEYGLLSPDQFIPLAESSGLIIPMGQWILQSVCEQIQSWRSRGLSALRVAVNLSGSQFHQVDFVSVVQDILEDTGTSPALIELEITESVLMHNVEWAKAAINELHRLGLELSIDDFGTGYSSLSYLSRFPIDRIKIDRSFVMGLDQNRENAEIAQAIIQLGHNLNLSVVAEGVETGAELEVLQLLKCDEIQGFYFSRPLEPDALADFILQYESES